MLAVRIIPSLLVRGRQLIKGQQFKSWRSVGVAIQAAKIHAMRGVDELCILDIGATPEGRGPDLAMIEELADGCFTPLAVGGGVKSPEDVNQLLRHGADKAVIGTAALDHPDFIFKCADTFGCQAIVVALDVMYSSVYANCGTRRFGSSPLVRARDLADAGAGEILLTSIEREGMMCGYDLDLIGQVSRAVNIPVIAHGGCGTPQHAYEAIQAGASAVAIGAMFQFTDETPASVAAYLAQHGIEVRHDRAA